MLLMLGLAGCGIDFNEVLFQTGTIVGRTAVDLILTDVATGLAEAADQALAPPEEESGETGTESGGGGSGAPALGDLTGDAASGQMVFEANSCFACHCADAVGGCALDAPSIQGVEAAMVNNRLRGPLPHPIKPDVTSQDIVDLAAFLGSF